MKTTRAADHLKARLRHMERRKEAGMGDWRLRWSEKDIASVRAITARRGSRKRVERPLDLPGQQHLFGDIDG